ncbi:MAG: SpaH/EbpB family LPXTG-anchored major pilin [Leucobacter sp.]
MTATRTNGAGRASRGGAAAALLATLSLVLGIGIATPAHAVDLVLPEGPKTLVVHPGVEPEPSDQPGTGLPPAPGGETGVAGHTFEVKRVPGLKLERTVDWNRAVDMTPADAAPLVANEPVAAEGVAAADNSVVFSGLKTGLYLVTETAAPAGSIRSVPFLVVLPLPHPTKSGEWLSTVHVYPKTASVMTKLGVRDADAVTCGDPVVWAAVNAIPAVKSLASYRVQHVLADGVKLTGTPDDTVVKISGQPALTPGDDYTVSETTVDGRTALETSFTEAGIAKLLVNPSAGVLISFTSSVSAPGEYTNEVRLYAGNAGVVTDTATTKFGPLRILVHEKGHPNNLIKGADFRLYTSEADARASKRPVTVAGGTDLRTSADGLITVPCLRYSGFANGLDREPGSKLFRDYFAKPVSYPAGWTGEDVILRGSVESATEPETLRAVVWKASPVIPPVPGLSETGGKVAAAALLGGVLLAVGIVVVARSRREPREN